MARCPHCGADVATWMASCPACEGPLPPAAPARPAPADRAARPAFGLGAFCLCVGMIVALIGSLASLAAGIVFTVAWTKTLWLLAGVLGFCQSFALFVVFRKVRELPDFKPPSGKGAG